MPIEARSSRAGRASRKAAKTAALEFKSATLTVPVLFLADNDLNTIDEQLRRKIGQAADFFKDSPLLIDLQQLSASELPIDLAALVDLVRQLGLMPIGIRGGSEEHGRQALAMELPVHSLSPARGASAARAEEEARARAAETEPQQDETPETAPEKAQADRALENRIISQPVRSGQRVYARGDLTVTASVSAGAEIMAEGNIHVYGTLRGRALAGVLGDTTSRIFCMDLQAELLSIAGIYQLSDDIEKEQQSRAAQISLENQTLVIKAI